MLKTWYSTAELMGMPGMPGTQRAMQHRAQQAAWPFRERAGQGGGREYHLSVLPQAMQVAWAQAQTLLLAQALEVEGLCLPAKAVLERALMARSRQTRQRSGVLEGKEAGLIAYQQATPGAQARAEARLTLLETWWGYRQMAGGRQEDALQAFLRAVQAGLMPMPPALRGVSRARLFAWEKGFRQAGIGGLLDHYGPTQRGTRRLSQTQQDFVLGLISTQTQVTMTVVAQALRARFGREAVPHYQTIRRFVERWKQANKALYLYVTNRDAWRSKYRVAFGNASAAIVRLNQRWEMDSTPGDVLLGDNRRHSIIGVIDVYSRRLRLLVSPTSKATAVANCLRGALLEWGVPEEVTTDNGQDYVSHHIERILAALEIHQDLCEPGTPESKPHIERVFKTFAHALLPLLPEYIGHNVATREAIRAQQTFAQRLLTPGEAIPVGMSAQEFQVLCDRWSTAVYAQTPHTGTGMHGWTPEAKARAWREPVRRIQDVRALEMLLAPVAGNNGIRTITRNGIEVAHRQHIAPELAGHIGEKALVQIDERDLACVYVYLLPYTFLCIAECPEWTGVSQAEVARVARRVQQEMMSAGRKGLKRAAREAGVEAVQEEILGYYEARQEKVITLPVPEEPYTTPALEEAAQAVAATETRPLALEDRARRGPPPTPAGAAPSTRQEGVTELMLWGNNDGYKRFEWLLRQSPSALVKEQSDWMIRYQDTNDQYTNWLKAHPPYFDPLLATWNAWRQTHAQEETAPALSTSARGDADTHPET